MSKTALKVKRFPIRKSNGNYAETYNLLLYEGHYCARTNFNRFGGGGETHAHVCPNCLGKYVGDETFDNHKRLCNELNDKGSYIQMAE